MDLLLVIAVNRKIPSQTLIELLRSRRGMKFYVILENDRLHKGTVTKPI